MNKIMHYSIVILMLICVSNKVSSLEVQVTAKEYAKIKLLLVVMGATNESLMKLATFIQKDLIFSGQFDVTIGTSTNITTKAEMISLGNQGYPLAIFITGSPHEDAIEWRLYDTQQAAMLKGKKYYTGGRLIQGWAHAIADAVWPLLTAQEGFFSTKIAYCKDIEQGKKRYKHIYIADYDGSNAQPLVATATINLAPRFNYDSSNPLVFYSESTRSNIRLMVVDMNRTIKMASNFDGINMLPSFSRKGSVVYCASHGNGNCQLYCYEKNQSKQITSNTGNNISPSLSDDGKLLFFCSDYQQGRPHIYCYNMITGLQHAITSGYDPCYCPVYSSKKKLLAYIKMVNGTMQLFVYDEKTGNHNQLTFDGGNKDECSWSPCGNYLLFGVEQGRASRIALFNVLTNECKYISNKQDKCNYPTWSPSYAQCPYLSCA